eukprot:CAMPEP_0175165388 /NCGR_PEP_ID=MMETSP0087-20121206/27057_1 /TAXON_ID=136419 /ORGANISM="Unknown Unknown, Strain D1" /LENGTH=49 /DNA_ID= /DNA_START= /DNA_END= /DNA_ORIENTATION=
MAFSAAATAAVDPDYPGTAVVRMNNARQRARSLHPFKDLSADWEDVRRR